MYCRKVTEIYLIFRFICVLTFVANKSYVAAERCSRIFSNFSCNIQTCVYKYAIYKKYVITLYTNSKHFKYAADVFQLIACLLLAKYLKLQKPSRIILT